MPTLDRKRIADEVLELLSAKLPKLPLPADHPELNIESVPLDGQITTDPLDIAEIGMDLEDAFGISFDHGLPGEPGLETVGLVIDYVKKAVDGQVDAIATVDEE